MLARVEIPMATFNIFGSVMFMALVVLRSDETGSGQYKMAPSKLDIPISQLHEQI